MWCGVVWCGTYLNVQVLPCVANGRLTPCTSPNTLPLSEYIDVPRLKERYYNRIISFDELKRMNETKGIFSKVKTVKCMHHQCLLRGFGAGRKDGLRNSNALGVLGEQRLKVVKLYNMVSSSTPLHVLQIASTPCCVHTQQLLLPWQGAFQTEHGLLALPLPLPVFVKHCRGAALNLVCTGLNAVNAPCIAAQPLFSFIDQIADEDVLVFTNYFRVSCPPSPLPIPPHRWYMSILLTIIF